MSRRAICPACGYSVRLRKNGYPERHRIYASQVYVCPGGEEMRTVHDKPREPVAYFLSRAKGEADG